MFLAVILIIAFCCNLLLPSGYVIERSIDLEYPVEKVYPYIADFQSWENWYQWKTLDPSIKLTYQGTMSQPGSKLAWSGPAIGMGYSVLLEKGTNKFIDNELKILTPNERNLQEEWLFEPTENTVKVIWRHKGSVGFWQRFMIAFRPPNKYQAATMEQSLVALRKWCSQQL